VSDLRSGIPELIEDGLEGFRVLVGDIRGFAQRVAGLQRNEGLRERMAQAAYNKVNKSGSDYRLDRMIESYAELFETIAEQAQLGNFHRPQGKIQPPPNLPWPERLPGTIQMWGHGVKQFLRNPIGTTEPVAHRSSPVSGLEEGRSGPVPIRQGECEQ
jgi:hypothetical protein